MRNRKPQRRNGFTLVEVLIVVVILGILAATVLPQFAESTDDANEAAILRNVQTIRSQIQLYRFQHNGALPGSGGTHQALELALTKATNPDGSDGGTLGPYLMGEFPANPVDGDATVHTIATPNNAGGWFYDSATGNFGANTP